MKLVLVVAGAVAALFAVGGMVQFFAASTDAAGAFRANLALAYSALAVGLLVVFCALHAVLSRLDALLHPDAAAERAGPGGPAPEHNPYESLTRYYVANNERER